MVKSIYLQDGEEIFVDDEDYERVSQYTWTKLFNDNARSILNNEHKRLQNFLIKGSYQINKNNNFSKSNLTTEGNPSRWRKANVKSKSKYKGVHWDKNKKKWRAKIYLDGKIKYLGRYANEDDAAHAYNQAVLEYWDGNGYLNIIGKDNRTKEKNYKTHKIQKRSRARRSNYKGVRERGNLIYAQMTYQYNNIYIGATKNKEEAALLYNRCAIYLYGDDAILNNVSMTDELKEFISNWEIPEKIKQLKD